MTGADLVGYKVEASDGGIGKVDRASHEVNSSYLVVDTGPWIFGKKVMIPAGTVNHVDHDERKVYVDRSKDQIKAAPEYDETADTDPAYRDKLGGYYDDDVLADSAGYRPVTVEPAQRPVGHRPTGRYRVRRGHHRVRTAGSRFRAMFNFRDVGGYTGHDGRTVRRGRLYRSDSLHRIDETDREAFAALGVRTVIDLRRPTEVERDGRVPDVRRADLPQHPPRARGTGPSVRTTRRRPGPLPRRPVRRPGRDRRPPGWPRRSA